MPNPASAPDYGVRAPADFNPRTEPALDFPDADYGALTPGDYDALGFLGGLEVHQQLRTRSKLFCRCPAGRRADTHDAEVLRHMRPTLSELGEYDGTALMEFKTKKDIVYRLERGSVCTYEIDDTPPFVIDDEAVEVAIAQSMLLNLNLVSELHVMRKQYLDGSIPTGFQRTAMVGLDGAIPFVVPELGVDRELRIRQLSLEEDSCREVSDVGHRITFRTDRLGMPLTEAVTEPDLRTPLEVQAAGRLLADVARATGRVRRGPGAARQDVNVSVAGGRRIEIKGVDNHRRLPVLVHIEAFRQLNLLRIQAELRRRGVTADLLTIPERGHPWEVAPQVVDVGEVLARTDYPRIGHALDRGETVCAVRLAGFGGLLAHGTQPGITFAQEFSERVRVIACPTHRPFLLHSDLGEYGLGAGHWREVRRLLGAEGDDTVVVVWGHEPDAATAAREVLIRAREALTGVPAETRQAFADGTTGFERILPGPDRMYPDTDTPPVPIADRLVEAIRVRLPERPWDREARLLTLGLDRTTARRLVRADLGDLFDDAAPPPGPLARRLAASLLKRMPFHRRRAGAPPVVNVVGLTAAMRAVHAGEIRPEALDRLVDDLIRQPDVSAQMVLDRYRIQGDDETRLRERIDRVVEEARGMPGRSHATLVGWAMGRVMPAFLGKADPATVRERLAGTLEASVPEVAT